jgi:hypothetical protein
VSIFFEHLEAGATVDSFLGWYEGVTREQVLDVLKHAERSLTPRKPKCGYFSLEDTPRGVVRNWIASHPRFEDTYKMGP